MEMNLYEAIKDRKTYLPEKKAKLWIYQTLKALEFMHRNGIFHRDIKPENILVRNNKVKLADLGSCKGMYSRPPFTEYISTRWYRSPECLLTDGYYNYKMDIWGLGCVFFEILTLVPLFPGDDEIDEVNKINYIIGSPSDELFEKFVKNSAHRNEFNFDFQKGIGIQRYLTHVSPCVVDLITKMLIYDPDKRLTAKQCLSHECFKEFVEQELKMTKMSQINFFQNSILMKSFNDSVSCIKSNDSMQVINMNNNNNKNNYNSNNYNVNNQNLKSKTLKTKKEASNSNLSFKNVNNVNNNYNYKNILLPLIKLNNINEDSKGEDSFNNSISKKNQDSYLRLPKIPQKSKMFGGIGSQNFLNSNEFKKIKHNISNHSIDKGMSSAFTHYEKKQKVDIRKKINEAKKNYISPYSKKTIENNLII
jgi:serine/threonine protein kinase